MRQAISQMEEENQRLQQNDRTSSEKELQTTVQIQNFEHILEKKQEQESFYIERMNQLE